MKEKEMTEEQISEDFRLLRARLQLATTKTMLFSFLRKKLTILLIKIG